jgi:outer membrane receptor protein involved in Fe transport
MKIAAKNFTPSILSIAVASAISTSTAFSQGMMLEEVIVTAQKREESLQDVSVSVVAISGEKLNQLNITNFDDLDTFVPNFRKSETQSGAVLSIRGIGTGTNVGFEQSVVQYVDDVAYGRGFLSRVPFLDLARIEVLRGPQNVLFGKNSVGGALSMTTAKPTEEFEGSISVQYEPEYDNQQATLVLSGGLTDDLRGRLAVRAAERGGYYENLTQDTDEANTEDTSIRLALAWDISENLEAILKLERNDSDTLGAENGTYAGYDAPAGAGGIAGLNYAEFTDFVNSITPYDIGSPLISEDYERATDFEDRYELTTDLVQLTVNWDTDNFTLTSDTALLSYDSENTLDGDATAITAFNTIREEEYSQFSQSIRFTSPGGETLDWIAGGFYQQWDLDAKGNDITEQESYLAALAPFVPGIDQAADILSIYSYEGESKTYALFGQVTWNINEANRLVVGGRYTREEKDGRRVLNVVRNSTGDFDLAQAAVASDVFESDYNELGKRFAGATAAEINATLSAAGVPANFIKTSYNTHDAKGSREENSFTPTVTYEWDVTADNMAYATYTTGFKAGGFDAAAALEKNFEYEDENVTSYEIGLKSTLLDGAAEFNIAAFYMEFDDLQVSSFSQTGFVVGNAGEVTTQGIEAEGRWLVAEGLTLSGAVGYLDHIYDSYEGAACNPYDRVTFSCDSHLAALAADPTVDLSAIEALDDKSGDSAEQPEWSASMGADYVFPVSDAIDLRTTLNANYESSTTTGLDEELTRQGDYVLFDFRMALEADSWTLAVLGKNITDEKIIDFTYETPLSTTFSSAPAYTSYLKPPRTIAVQFDYRF